MTEQARPRVAIVGAGFGGLWAARALNRAPVDVLLIDRNNYHTFLALLYQVAAAELEPEEIAYPVRSILRRQPRARFILAEVQEIDLAGRMVQTAGRSIPYDYLIVALGSTTNYLSVPGAAEHAFALKTLDHGVVLRNHILCSFEYAAYEPDAGRRQQLPTFAIVGGGATGVEFAGALAELVRSPLIKDYPTLDRREVRVVLLEAAARLLPAMPERLGLYAVERLRRMGVEVRLQAQVQQVTEKAVHLQDGTVLPTATVVWTAGVRGNTLARRAGLATAGDGRVVVQPTLQVPGRPETYVIGDLAYLEEQGRALPMVAPVAIQEGAAAARNIARQVAGQEPLPFHYHDRGTMATIGRNAAVAHIAGQGFTGLAAWGLWLGVHLVNLIGFRNRLLVLINWAWDYFLFERAVRLILPADAGPPCRSAGRDG